MSTGNAINWKMTWKTNNMHLRSAFPFILSFHFEYIYWSKHSCHLSFILLRGLCCCIGSYVSLCLYIQMWDVRCETNAPVDIFGNLTKMSFGFKFLHRPVHINISLFNIYVILCMCLRTVHPRKNLFDYYLFVFRTPSHHIFPLHQSNLISQHFQRRLRAFTWCILHIHARANKNIMHTDVFLWKTEWRKCMNWMGKMSYL